MSAEILREAAALMRERAEAIETPDGDALTESWAEAAAAHVPGADGEHIASWHPAVALAVADWLDGVAGRVEAKISRGGGEAAVWSHELHALAVARAYLGRPA